MAPEGYGPVTRFLERCREFPGWCKRCFEGDACKHWSLGLLQDEGYGPSESQRVEQAAKRLGLRWPWTQDHVIRAFRARIQFAHPDHGGTDAAMRQLLGDRDRLLEWCGCESGHFPGTGRDATLP
jgi:hypothetical protein